MKKIFLLLICSAWIVTSCNEKDPDGLSPDVIGYYEGYAYLPLTGFKSGVLNKKDHTAIYYRGIGVEQADTVSAQKFEATWTLNDGTYRLEIPMKDGTTWIYEDKNVTVPGAHIDGDLTIENSTDKGQFDWGRPVK